MKTAFTAAATAVLLFALVDCAQAFGAVDIFWWLWR